MRGDLIEEFMIITNWASARFREWVATYMSSAGARSRLHGGLGALPPVGPGVKPLVRGSGGEAP